MCLGRGERGLEKEDDEKERMITRTRMRRL